MQKTLSAILQAGQIALQEQKNLVTQTKADGSIVTNGDLAVSRFLEQKLHELYPNWTILSEENYQTSTEADRVIILDPIDGTSSYHRNEETWCILVGFLDRLQPIQGFVYQPTTGHLYFGEKEKGAFFQEPGKTPVRLNAEGIGPLKGIKSRKECGETGFFKANGIEHIEQMYSAALKILKVASGEIDVYAGFQKACSIWDMVAPQCILEEAGGRIEYAKPFQWSLNDPRIPERFCAVGRRIQSGSLNWN